MPTEEYEANPHIKFLKDEWTRYASLEINLQTFLNQISPRVHYILKWNDFMGFLQSFIGFFSAKYSDWTTAIANA